MAFTVTEVKVTNKGGDMEGQIVLECLCVSDAGSTGGAIQPGNQLVGTNIAAARAMRSIDRYHAVSETAANPVRMVKSYDAAHDGEIITLLNTANETIRVWLYGRSSGLA